MFMNTMTFTFRDEVMTPDELEASLPMNGAAYLFQVNTGSARATGQSFARQAEVRWLTNWPASGMVVVPFAVDFTQKWPVEIKYVSRAEKEGIQPVRDYAGTPNHLMPDGVNVKTPAVRTMAFNGGISSPEELIEDSWIAEGTSQELDALKALATSFVLVDRLVAAIERFDTQDQIDTDHERHALATSLRNAAKALTDVAAPGSYATQN
jgi:hypothetical protein